MVWSSIPSTDNRFYSSAVTDGNIAIFAGGLSMSSNPSSILDGFSVSVRMKFTIVKLIVGQQEILVQVQLEQKFLLAIVMGILGLLEAQLVTI